MSKNALGSRPSFTNVAKATGDLANDLDFSSDLEEKKNPILLDAEDEEEQKRQFKERRQEAQLKEVKKELKELEREVIEEVQEEKEKTSSNEKATKEKKDKDTRPNNKKHLAQGYTRATFAVKDEHLELIKAIASYKGLEQKELLEALLEDALGKIKQEVKDEALASFRRKEEKGKTTLRDLIN